MAKISNSKEEEMGTLHNVETFVLDRICSVQGAGNYSTSIRELITSIDQTMYPLLDQSIEELTAQNLIQSEDRENYQITLDGINELKSRKNEPIPL